MRKIRVNVIVAIVTIALLALLIIQVIQTLQLYDRKSTQFTNNLSTSLERIAIRHEKAEDMRKYLHIVNHDFSGQYKNILKEEFKHLLAAKESISIHDTAIFENGQLENYLIIKGKAFDTLTGLTTEQRVLARDARQLKDLLDKKKKVIPHNDSVKLAIQLDQRVIQQVFRKAKFVNDMMVETFRNNVYKDLTQRIDVLFLDSVIQTEIKNDDLPHTYQFMVTDEYGKPLKFKQTSSNYNAQLDTVLTGKTVLFPSNILDENCYLQIYFPKKGVFLFQEMWGPFVISLTLMILIVVALMIMFKTILAQEKLSEIKNDFISNMTHEFKTPISTISLACEALNDKDMISTETTSIQPFVKMIQDENQRLSLLVERILQSAVMDRGDLKLKEEIVVLNETIHEVANNAQFRIQNSGGEIRLHLPNESLKLHTDKMHLTNVITNLVDNGIKYSKDIPSIDIFLKSEGNKLILTVADKGIGIRKEHLSKIFDKLYRVPTGNLHNVKGFGLGLSYVKAIAEINGWNVTVRSKFGEGTEFCLILNDTNKN